MPTKHRPNPGRRTHYDPADYECFERSWRLDATDPWSPHDEDYAAHGVTIMVDDEIDLAATYWEQDDVHRWEDERGLDSPRIALRKRMDREHRARLRLGRNPFRPVNDVEVARALSLPPTTARRTAPRPRGAGRPAGRPAARTSSRSGDSGDDGSGSSGGDDPHLANAARTLAAILRRREPQAAWTVEVGP